NAFRSWARLKPKPEVIVFGGEEGGGEIYTELGIRHVPDAAPGEGERPLLSDMFRRAEALTSNSAMCYLNADIILLPDFSDAVRKVMEWNSRFLLVGRRHSVAVDELIAFDDPGWPSAMRGLIAERGVMDPPTRADVFVFSRG